MQFLATDGQRERGVIVQKVTITFSDVPARQLDYTLPELIRRASLCSDPRLSNVRFVWWEAFRYDATDLTEARDGAALEPIATPGSTISIRTEARFFTHEEIFATADIPPDDRWGTINDLAWHGFCLTPDADITTRRCPTTVETPTGERELQYEDVDARRLEFRAAGRLLVALEEPPLWALAAGDALVRDWRIDITNCCEQVSEHLDEPASETTTFSTPEVLCFE